VEAVVAACVNWSKVISPAVVRASVCEIAALSLPGFVLPALASASVSTSATE
jgi:hypothetical protein